MVGASWRRAQGSLSTRRQLCSSSDAQRQHPTPTSAALYNTTSTTNRPPSILFRICLRYEPVLAPKPRYTPHDAGDNGRDALARQPQRHGRAAGAALRRRPLQPHNRKGVQEARCRRAPGEQRREECARVEQLCRWVPRPLPNPPPPLVLPALSHPPPSRHTLTVWTNAPQSPSRRTTRTPRSGSSTTTTSRA